MKLNKKGIKSLCILIVFVTMVSVLNHFPMVGMAMENNQPQNMEEEFVQTEQKDIDTYECEYTFVIDDIFYITFDGQTYAYVKAADCMRILRFEFKESLLLLNAGDNVTFRISVDKRSNEDYPIVHVIESNGIVVHPANT